jgi:hypothetical protein
MNVARREDEMDALAISRIARHGHPRLYQPAATVDRHNCHQASSSKMLYMTLDSFF